MGNSKKSIENFDFLRPKQVLKKQVAPKTPPSKILNVRYVEEELCYSLRTFCRVYLATLEHLTPFSTPRWPLRVWIPLRWCTAGTEQNNTCWCCLTLIFVSLHIHIIFLVLRLFFSSSNASFYYETLNDSRSLGKRRSRLPSPDRQRGAQVKVTEVRAVFD